MNENRRVIKGFIILSLLFVLIIGYLSVFELFWKDDIIQNSYNRRIWDVDTGRIRGSILDRDGQILAYSELNEDDSAERIYPYGEAYAHVIGYHSLLYGNSQLEAAYQNDLSGNKAWNHLVDIPAQFSGQVLYGNQLTLTLDHELQMKALELLGGRNGAVVALDPQTGAVLALASNPSFDPNQEELQEIWGEIHSSEESILLPRATQGLYPPGSTFKILTTAAAAKSAQLGFVWDDQGTIDVDGTIIHNFSSQNYGEVGLDEAFAKSINTYFAALGLEMGEGSIENISRDFYFNRDIPFSLLVSTSIFPQESLNDAQLAATSIGQGQLLVTPMHMALIAATIANDGTMMEPYLVQEVRMNSQRLVEDNTPTKLTSPLTTDMAQRIKELMIQVVETGTGTNAKITGISVAGKTGTAQNEREGEDHAWFIGFAPAEDPKIAVAVLVEYSGSTGGKTAAPIAGKLMEFYLK